MVQGVPFAGQVVGEYLLDAPIGRGAMGEVWRAHHHVWTSRQVAIKIPTNHEYLRSIQKEGIVHEDLSRLDSPHIVKVLGLNVLSQPPHMVMEYVAGSDLRARMKAAGKLPVPETLRVLEGVLTGLSLAHERGIVHRDIKPENVLLDESGLPKLTDFSIALRGPNPDSLRMSIETDPDSAPSLAGTLVYMSPEQRQGAAIGPRSDVFSIGIMLFEMLTGELPQPGDQVADFLPGVATGIEALFQGCFTRQDRRFASAKEVLTVVKALRSGANVPATIQVHVTTPSGQQQQQSAGSQRATQRIPKSPPLSTRDLPARSEAAPAPTAPMQTPSGTPVMSTRSLDAVKRQQAAAAQAEPAPTAPPVMTPKIALPAAQTPNKGAAPRTGSGQDEYLAKAQEAAREAARESMKRAQSSSAQTGIPLPAGIDDLQKLLSELPEDGPAQRLAASDPRLSRQYDEVLPSLEALYRQRQTATGVSYMTAGRYADAEQEFRKLASQDATGIAPKKGLAMSLFRQGKPKEALKVYREVLELSPTLAEVWNNVGVVSMSLGRLRDAEKALLKAIELRPRYASAHSNLGAVYQQQGRIDEARREAAIALEIDPDNMAAGFNASI